MHNDVVVIIPSRLNSERLHQKPLQLIGGVSMIERVVRQVQKTGLSNIYVATDSDLISKVVEGCGVKSIMTDPNCPSGTDRVYETLKLLPNSENIEYIINVQGDMPFVEPEVILAVVENLKKSSFGIMTPVTKVDFSIANSHSNVKVIVDCNGRALYFSRNIIPHGGTEFLYHIGIYGFKRDALVRFMSLPYSYLEKSERLEQLRALEHGIEIGVCYVDNVPISVDTQEDLDKAIEFFNK